MKKVLGIGNALVDIMVKMKDDSMLDEFSLARGSMTLIDEYVRFKILDKIGSEQVAQTSGGCAANTVHGLASLGVETGFIGKVGDDELGEFFQKDMEKVNIHPHLSISKSNTGTAIALVSPDTERTFATYLGAAVEMSADELRNSWFDNYDIFHIEGYLLQNHELIQKSVTMAKEHGMMVSVDLASYNVVESNLEFLKSLVKLYIDIVFANEEEAKAFTGKEPEDALHEIAEICDIAVVKKGAKGSLIKQNGKVYNVGIISANAIDTTGAGDLYAAGFLYGLIHNKPLDRCGKIGAILSGRVIEDLGAKMSDNTWKKIKTEIKSLY